MTGFRLGNKKEKLSPSTAKPSALVDEVSAPRNFGIRNYLHQFYVTPTGEELESGAWYLLPPPPAQRRGLLVCRVCTLIGLFLLIAGAVAITVGYTWKYNRHIEQSIERFVLFQDENGGLYLPSDKLQLILQDPMRYWKTTGFCLFASGSVLLAVSLIIPTLAACVGTRRFAAFASNDNSPNEPPVRVFPQTIAAQAATVSSGPVPVMEEISKVQPSERKSPTVTPDLLDQEVH
ncbi:unnamed protein product [Caenorhabditis bovis]|uniref:Uncharacterized protein n=1 Tax=Caenorhabditis bovis TaxID=2654633 RepID=A0A8S1EAJ4_9PELO|nr:unnamed protein product [Caenorhabditis bovis]